MLNGTQGSDPAVSLGQPPLTSSFGPVAGGSAVGPLVDIVPWLAETRRKPSMGAMPGVDLLHSG
jgi:hypothetical protein